MKVAHAEKHVLGTAGLQEEKGFEIRASAHAFKILSSGLYSDKVTAVLREIGCNAYDAHVEAGIAHRPFEVKLPNALDAQFYVRDYGPGLSHDEVMKLYTTYFASTKQDSNEFTGAFGLGSKSPFSYTDSFTVTSVNGGVKRLYTAHIGDKGSPVIALMSETTADADWPSGLEVGFPVRPGEYPEFHQKAQEVFCAFATVPTVVGAPPVRPVTYSEDFGEYAFSKEDSNQIWALMGNVRYPISPTALGVDEEDDSSLLGVAAKMTGLVLRVPIGKIQVTASREEIQYDPITQRYLRAKLKTVVLDVLKNVEKAYAKIKTWRDMCEFHQMKESIFRGVYVNEDLFKHAKISNKALIDMCTRDHVRIPEPQNDQSALVVLRREDKGDRFRLRTDRVGTHGYGWFDLRDDVTLVYGAENRAYARARQGFREGTLTGRVILVHPKNKGTLAEVAETVDQVLKVMPRLPERPLGSLPPPSDNKIRTKKGRKILPPLPDLTVKYDGGAMSIRLVPDDRKIYVPVLRRYDEDRHWFLNPDKTIESWAINAHKEWLKIVSDAIPGMGMPEPITLSRKEIIELRLRKRPGWREYFPILRDRLTDPDNLQALTDLVGSHEPVVNMATGEAQDLLSTMVCFKEHEKELFEAARPVLKRHGVLQEILDAHKRSVGKDYQQSITKPPVLYAYEHLIQVLDIQVNTPEFHAATLSLNKRFPGTDGVEYEEYKTVFRLAPNTFPAFLEELMTKEEEPQC